MRSLVCVHKFLQLCYNYYVFLNNMIVLKKIIEHACSIKAVFEVEVFHIPLWDPCPPGCSHTHFQPAVQVQVE